ncbi:hypothetical protein ZYGR_0AG00290 [Zygosaccharomyces rouxii]|uniref:Nitrogen permease regulator 3 n=1 Tax=Zygosaccharomyces rouxii TaxID=4956 RepID=A0A1Q3A8P5_ZYGRO|nr:hypothetical protein ZYGR_0AG00290 [Zygosaccharomyces rouxii]
MHEFLPNSCLLGIHLTISTHSGPQVVYHYPPASEDYISSKQRRSRQDSTGVDDSESNGKIYAGNLRKKNSMGASLTGQSLFSNDQKFNDDDNIKTPSIRSGGTGSIRKRRAHSVESGKIRNDVETESSLSDVDSSSSGLSDSELSTDFADESSDSSSSSEHERDEESEDITNEPRLNNSSSAIRNNTSGTTANLETPKILKSKSSQVSASKLLDIFNKEVPDRRPSAISKVSNAKTLESSEDEADDDQESELDFSELHERGKIVFDKQYFSENVFQDVNKIFGLDAEFVAEFCSPEREMCNTRYEFTVDTLCFLGLPVHVDQHGNWRKSKRKKHTTRSKRSSSTATRLSKQRSGPSQNGGGDSGENDMDSSQLKSSSRNSQADDDDDDDEFDEDDEQCKNPNNENMKEDLEKNMNMFHVCFVMNPSLVEYNERIDDMFHYAVARLSMLLRYAQEKSQYVSKECSIIMKEKEHVLKHSKTYRAMKKANQRGKYLYQCILSKSSLARALTLCVEKLQQNDIACLEIGEDKVIALQIPIQNEFAVLPNFKLHPVLRGSFLSSILNSQFLSTTPVARDDSLGGYTDSDNQDFNDLLNFALLLDEPTNIIKELETFSYQDDIGNIVLSHIVKHIQPNVPLGSYQYLIDDLFGDTSDDLRDSFQKNMLRSCALHLLYRRHARLIIPISSRNTYIVSPLAPIRGYSKNDYDEQQNSSMPLIYQNQTIFKERFPTLPSLPSFLHLLSNGKPKPYGNIIPSKEHKSIYLGALAWLLRYGYVTQLLTFICVRVDRQIKMAVDEDLEKEGFKAKTHSVDRDHDAVDNVAKSSKDLQTSQKNRTSSNEEEEEEEDIARFAYDDPDIGRDYTIILEPERATAIEKRWMFKCVQDQPADIQKLFGKMLKYFNGRTPMELVTLKEGISRHDIRKLIGALDRYVIEFDHW